MRTTTSSFSMGVPNGSIGESSTDDIAATRNDISYRSSVSAEARFISVSTVNAFFADSQAHFPNECSRFDRRVSCSFAPEFISRVGRFHIPFDTRRQRLCLEGPLNVSEQRLCPRRSRVSGLFRGAPNGSSLPDSISVMLKKRSCNQLFPLR